MKKIVLLFSAFLITFACLAQTKNPVSLTYSSVKKADGTVDVVVAATIEKGWHIYSKNTDKGGPIPTSITYKINPLAKANGKLVENGKVEKVFDKTFGVNVLYYSNSVQFVQNFKVKPNIKTKISGTIEYMVCDDEMCLPPKKQSFEVSL